MKHFIAIILCIIFARGVTAQYTRYIVRLRDKGSSSYTLQNPSAYLSSRAITRRTTQRIAVDSLDLPVSSSYLQQISQVPNVTILNTSKWLNAIAIQTNDPAALQAIAAFPFVNGTKGLSSRATVNSIGKFREDSSSPILTERQQGTLEDFYNYGGTSLAEIRLHNGEFLHNIGLRGQGMQIALLDGGFYQYTTLKAFDSINTRGQVLSTWDFVSRNASVVEDNSHGMSCLSIIAANIPGQFTGKAPGASFHLFRTEDAGSESPLEEFNWACGAERADSTGADIISSSLGYGYGFDAPTADYPYSDLNGDITMASRAADVAASKGLLIFNAAGNSGTDYWKMIITPADADSVLAIGAVDANGNIWAGSSYGPSADGRIKPDVASIGWRTLIQFSNNTLGLSNGTSFACPNMAGLGTCLWQGFPEFSNMRVVRALKEAGNRYNNPDNRTGYGIPDMKKAFGSLLVEYATASYNRSGCTAEISWQSKDVSAMRYELERKLPGETVYSPVDTIAASAGAELSVHSYLVSQSLTDLPEGLVSYRIRQIIDTSAAGFAAVYTDTINISLDAGCKSASQTAVFISPNPVTTQANLIVESSYAADRMQIRLFDMKGSLVLQMTGSKPAGRSSINLPVSHLPSGKYILKVYNGKEEMGTADLLKL